MSTHPNASPPEPFHTAGHVARPVVAKAMRQAAADYRFLRLRLSYGTNIGCYENGRPVRDLQELRHSEDRNVPTPLALSITAACYRHLPEHTADYLLAYCTNELRRTAAVQLRETENSPTLDRCIRLLLRNDTRSAELIAADLLHITARNLLNDPASRETPDPATSPGTQAPAPAAIPEDIRLLLRQAELEASVGPLFYLASPYTHADSRIMQLRLEAHSCAAAHLIQQGVNVHPPLLATAPLAEQGIKHPQGWYAYDAAFLRACEGGVIVLTLPGWQESFGVRAEVLAALAMRYPVRTIQPEEAGVPDHIQRALEDAA